MKRKIYYFSGTHWDREWYQTYQGFRLRLVRVIDDMLDYLENNEDFGVFHFDGQTIVLEDYLEIRPENRPRLEKLIQKRKILIGPWYCMPDEFLVSGEALIRNLQRGHRICEEFHVEPWRVGYVCDIFGHTAQFPQILKGFGLKGAVLGRGTNESTTPAFFNWQAPDGSTVPTYKIPDTFGYGAYAIAVLGQLARGQEIDPHSDAFRDKTTAYVNREFSRTQLPICVIMDAMDHEPLHPKTPEYLREIQKLYPDAEVLHADLERLFDDISAQSEQLPTKRGELYESGESFYNGFIHVLTHTLSSRSEIKRRNDQCEALLEKWLEPMLVFWKQTGMEYPQEYLHTAWKWLLQNHPHDSICGCSADRVHDEMGFRFSQVESICQTIEEDAEKAYAGGLKRCDEQNSQLTILNPTAYEYTGLVELTVPFAPDYKKYAEPFGYEKINAFRLYNQEGKEVPYAIKKMRCDTIVLPQGEQSLPADIYTLVCETKLNAFGTTLLNVVPDANPVRFFGSLALEKSGLDNGLVRVTVNGDGTLDLYDYGTKKNYAGLLSLLDDGEIGDGWHSVRPKCDVRVNQSRLISCAVTVDSPVYSELLVRRELIVPRHMTYADHGIGRSEETVSLLVEQTLGLSKHSRRVSVDLKFQNNAKDHRLRMAFPTRVETDSYTVNQAFAFVERSCGRKRETADWKEADQLEKSTNGIVSVRGIDGTGLAFIGKFGFHECAVDDDADRTLYVTLHRGFGRVYYAPDELTGAQELGEHIRSFTLEPLMADTSVADLQRTQDILQTSVRSFITSGRAARAGIKLDGDVAVSAIKPALDRSGDVIVRVYNPGAEEKAFSLRTESGFSQCVSCDLMEQPIHDIVLTVAGNNVSAVLPPFKICTLRFRMKP
ncbi:MAG: glycosyl hydrolase-related protein [Ethanoligenens sp.]